MEKVLFICLGNICRSPLAEALFRRHVQAQNLTHKISCDSCGTAAYHIGAPPDARSVANARLNGLEYSHRARQLQPVDFKNFTRLVVMDDSNLNNVLIQGGHVHPSITKMRDFDPLAPGSDVPDPYFGGNKGFQEVYEILDRATLHLLRHLRKSI